MRWGRADKGTSEGVHTGRHKCYQLISAGKEADIRGPRPLPIRTGQGSVIRTGHRNVGASLCKTVNFPIVSVRTRKVVHILEAPEALVQKWLQTLGPRGLPGFGRVILVAWAELVRPSSSSEHHVASLISSFCLTCDVGYYFEWIGRKCKVQSIVPLEQARSPTRHGLSCWTEMSVMFVEYMHVGVIA